MNGFRSTPRTQPWHPVRAHLAAIGGVIVFCLLAGIVLGVVQTLVIPFLPGGVAELPEGHWVTRLGWLAVGSLVAPLGLWMPGLFFVPIACVLLRFGLGGALSLAALGALIGTALFTYFPEPLLIGTIGGALLGWVYGRAFHYAAGRSDWKW